MKLDYELNRTTAKVLPEISETIRIIIVDDREENLIALEAALESPDYELVRATSGEQALRYLLDNDVALILMDVQMPGLDGFETASVIKSSERTRSIPIIFVTAMNKDDRYIHEGYEYGAVDYISKPFDVHVLRSKVSVFADLYRKTQRIIQAERKLRETEAKERERKIAELEIRALRREQAEQKRYRDLVEGIDHGIVWSAVPDSLAFLFVSPTAETLLGYPVEQWFQEPAFWDTHIHPDDSESFRSACKAAATARRNISIDHRLYRPDKSVMWFRTSIRHSAKSDGSGFELRGLSTDITKLKEVEQSLERNKERSDFLAQASFLLSSSFDYVKNLCEVGELALSRCADWYSVEVLADEIVQSITVAKSDANQLFSSQSFVDSLPISRNAAEAFTKSARSAQLFFNLSDEDRKELSLHKSAVEAARRLNLSSAAVVPLKVRGEQIGRLSFAVGPSRDLDKDDLSLILDLAGRIATAVDAATLYAKAQAAVKIRDEFMSIASHELKTPLTPLKLQVQGLMRMLKRQPDQLDTQQLERMLNSSNRQIDRISRLVEDLLDISRITNGRLSLHPEQFDFAQLIREITQRFADQLASARCELVLDLPDTLDVKLDVLRIEQVVVNLLANAIKYAPAKPIEISLKSDGKCVQFQIRDHGIGIASEDQSRIFMRFERAVSGRHFGGLGLGLYIVNQILVAHGGSIAVASSLGAGSLFTVELPRAIEAAVTEQAQ